MADEVTLESPTGGRVVVRDPAAVNTLVFGSGYRKVVPDAEQPEGQAAAEQPAAETAARPAAPAEPARTTTADSGKATKPATEK